MAESNKTKKYLYTGRTGKHVHDGKPLAHGDIVELTDGQAAAFPDRFELQVSKSETENLLHPETVPVGQMPPPGKPSPPMPNVGSKDPEVKTSATPATPSTSAPSSPASTARESESSKPVTVVSDPPKQSSGDLVKDVQQGKK
jgi:hypothetical protein